MAGLSARALDLCFCSVALPRPLPASSILSPPPGSSRQAGPPKAPALETQLLSALTQARSSWSTGHPLPRSAFTPHHVPKPGREFTPARGHLLPVDLDEDIIIQSQTTGPLKPQDLALSPWPGQPHLCRSRLSLGPLGTSSHVCRNVERNLGCGLVRVPFHTLEFSFFLVSFPNEEKFSLEQRCSGTSWGSPRQRGAGWVLFSLEFGSMLSFLVERKQAQHPLGWRPGLRPRSVQGRREPTSLASPRPPARLSRTLPAPQAGTAQGSSL